MKIIMPLKMGNLSKGHATATLYPILTDLGVIENLPGIIGEWIIQF